jgi:hypothetical protein
MIADLHTWLASLGLTAGQIVGWLFAIVVSFFAARFVASETRRQFRIKEGVDRRKAGSSLIRSLTHYADTCEEWMYDIDTYISSRGHAGKLHTLADAAIPSSVHDDAAIIGPNIVAAALKLSKIRLDAQQRCSHAQEYEMAQDEELATLVHAGLARMVLASSTLIDQVPRRSRTVPGWRCSGTRIPPISGVQRSRRQSRCP